MLRTGRWRELLKQLVELFKTNEYSSYAAMIVVPPGATLEHPAIGPHLLAAWAKQAGFRVAVFYANVIFAAISGEEEHQTLCSMTEHIWGERVFARAAYGTPLLGINLDPKARKGTPSDKLEELLRFRRLAMRATAWANGLATLLAEQGPRVIGCSSMFQQNAASLALLKRIKLLSPRSLTIMGGPNCHGEMAEGLLALCHEVDFVFSGEADHGFPEFLRAVDSNHIPPRGVIDGKPLLDMDTAPPPDYAEFYEQLSLFLPDYLTKNAHKMSLPYETSRGCWWGQKHHCTFCGLNATGMVFRAKSPQRVIDDLKAMLPNHPNRLINMVDNIMPHQYFKSLLPRLADELPNVKIFYEQKSNLSLEKVVALKQSGVTLVQPGIESLSTPLLQRMRKGVTARQNINLLRYCRSVGVTLVWNILYGFPGDLACDYDSMLSFLPKLRHLNPPAGVFPICIERFSPYFEHPQEYGITNLRPAEAYSTILPQQARSEKICSQFQADFASASLEDETIPAKLWQLVADWHQPWQNAQPPILELTELDEDTFVLVDTRGLDDTSKISFLNRRQASLALTGDAHADASDIDRALAQGWIVQIDNALQPLVVADPVLLETFERASQRNSIVRRTASLPIHAS